MMIRFYKIVFFLFTCLTSSLWIVTEGSSQNLGIATNPINPYDLKVDVKRAGDAFLIHVSFIVPIKIHQIIIGCLKIMKMLKTFLELLSLR